MEKEFYTYVMVDPRTDTIFYVGKGKGDRMKRHLSEAKGGYHQNKKLANKINNILKANLEVEFIKILETDIEEEAFNKEVELIAEIGLSNLCNLTEGGEGPKLTEEIKEKISNSLKASEVFQKAVREESRCEKISKALKGKPKPEGFSEKLREANLGKKHTEETKKKLSEHFKGLKITDEVRLEKLRKQITEANHKKRKVILQLDMDGNLIKEWGGVNLAAESLNIHQSNISCCLIGKTKTSGGFVWKYKGEE